MTDEMLDYWGLIFTANSLSTKVPGLTFTKFLAAPERYLESVTFGIAEPIVDGGDYYPLLPRQRAVFERLYEQELMEELTARIEADLVPKAARHTGTGYIERLRHHSYAASRERDPRRVQA